jgi:hypothetical protein
VSRRRRAVVVFFLLAAQPQAADDAARSNTSQLIMASSSSAAAAAVRTAKCLAVPTLFSGMLNMVNIFGLSSFTMSWQATSMGLGGILAVISALHAICASPLSQGMLARQKAFQQLACARCSGTVALVLTCFSILAWTQATLTTYDCAAAQNCAAAQLPAGCQVAACENYRDGWIKDPDCYSEWAHGRCSDGLNHFMSARPFGASNSACGQRTCCTAATLPPPAYQIGFTDISMQCSRDQRVVGLNCFNNVACKFFAPIYAAASGWAVVCSILFWYYLRSLVYALNLLRAASSDIGDGRRTMEMAQFNQFVTRAENLLREDGLSPRPGVAVATPIAAEPIAGVPITAAQPVVVVTGVAVPGGAAQPQRELEMSAARASEGSTVVAVPVVAQPVAPASAGS